MFLVVLQVLTSRCCVSVFVPEVLTFRCSVLNSSGIDLQVQCFSVPQVLSIDLQVQCFSVPQVLSIDLHVQCFSVPQVLISWCSVSQFLRY